MPPADGLFLAINDVARRTPWLHGPAAAYATYGIVVFAVLMLVGWWQARTRSAGLVAAALTTPVAAVIAFVVQQGVVTLVHEARPYAVHPDALVLIDKTTDPSFPSDHACLVGAIAAGLFFVDRRLGAVAAVLGVLMAVDRVYVGAHWPLDVVAGLALGAALAAAAMLVLRAPVTRLVGWASGNRLRPLVTA